MRPVKYYQVACYDKLRDGKCFDEMFLGPDEQDIAMDYLMSDTDDWDTQYRVFVHFENGDIYELCMVKEEKYVRETRD